MSTNKNPLSIKRRAFYLLMPFFLLFFLFLAYLLQDALQRSLSASTQEQMMLQVRLLLAELEVEQDNSLELQEIQEPRLKSAESDLKAYIYQEGNDAPVWLSPSAQLGSAPAGLETGIPRHTELVAQSTLGQAIFKRWGEGFALSYTVVFESDEVFETEEAASSSPATVSQRSSPYTLLLVDSGTEFSRQLGIFQKTLMLGLTIGMVVFLCIQFFVLRWIFRPLGNLETELVDIEQGKTERFSSDYPGELLPLTERLNLFFETERIQRKRYKNTLSDLAHSIKTPLAVIRSLPELAEAKDGNEVLDQVARMEQIVAHQLRRSVIPVQPGSSHQADATAVINRVTESLHKIYSDRNVALTIKLPDELWLRIPEDDLFEVIGNLLDNAFKYCENRVEVISNSEIVADSRNENAEVNPRGFASAQITIINDGAGVEPAHIERILERGVRYDEIAEGQGLGLSVARSIVSAYGGSLEVSAKQHSQLSVALNLPLATSR